MVRLMEKRYQDSGSFRRGVHPKSHGCVEAKFEVCGDIDEDLRVGLFRTPGSIFDALIRFSNADTLVRHDLRGGKHGSRGMALKILSVEGDVFYKDGECSSQDFLMINTPEFAFANVADYLQLQKVLVEHNDDPSMFFAPLKQDPRPTDPGELATLGRIARSFQIVTKINETPVANPLEVSYFGAAPFLFGDGRAMRVSVVPRHAPVPQVVDSTVDENYLRTALAKTMAGSRNVVFDFLIQVRGAGDKDLHIEDATQAWPIDQFRPRKVAHVTISSPQTDLMKCEKQFFTPWHALKVHQPLGGINRLRKAAYDASVKRRRM